MIINRFHAVLATAMFVAWLTIPTAAAPPNIVFILADDMGWSDVGCYGADLHETPNIDRFAAGGVRFTAAYAMSVCSPTRACLMTGKHAARLHMTIWREGAVDSQAVASGRKPAAPRLKVIPPAATTDLPLEEVTLAEALKSVGYLTFHVGKWHLGNAGYYPENQGFDVNIGGTEWGAPDTYFYPFKGTGTFHDFRYVPGLGVGKPGDELTDRFTDEAIKLMDAAGDRPFFLNLWYHSVHTPIEGKPELVEKYRNKLTDGMHHRNPGYAAMNETLDTDVARVLRYLDEKHLADHTIVVFMSDNGGFINPFKGQPVTNNAPLRSGKGSLYEGGIRVPMIVRWPGVTPAAGATCDEPAMCTDWFKTLTDAAAVPPKSLADSGKDGLSLTPVLKNPSARLGRDAIYFHYPHYYATTTPVGAIRHGDWKLLEYFEDGKLELYNLKDDLAENNDLAAKMPEKAKELRDRLADWRKEVGAQMPAAKKGRGAPG